MCPLCGMHRALRHINTPSVSQESKALLVHKGLPFVPWPGLSTDWKQLQSLVFSVSSLLPFFGSRIQVQWSLSSLPSIGCVASTQEYFQESWAYSFYCWFKVRYLWSYFSLLVFQKEDIKPDFIWLPVFLMLLQFSLFKISSSSSASISLLQFLQTLSNFFLLSSYCSTGVFPLFSSLFSLSRILHHFLRFSILLSELLFWSFFPTN